MSSVTPATWKRQRLILAICLGLLVLVVLWRLKGIILRPSSVSEDSAVFAYLADDGTLAKQKSVVVDGVTLTGGIRCEGISDFDGLLLSQGWPYVLIELSGESAKLRNLKIPIDAVVVRDSLGHRFHIVALVPDRSGDGRRLRAYLDALEFSKRVWYQKTLGWEQDTGEWDSRYTVSLSIRGSVRDKDLHLEIPQLAVFWRAGLPRTTRSLLGSWPKGEPRWDPGDAGKARAVEPTL